MCRDTATDTATDREGGTARDVLGVVDGIMVVAVCRFGHLGVGDGISLHLPDRGGTVIVYAEIIIHLFHSHTYSARKGPLFGSTATRIAAASVNRNSLGIARSLYGTNDGVAARRAVESYDGSAVEEDVSGRVIDGPLLAEIIIWYVMSGVSMRARLSLSS